MAHGMHQVVRDDSDEASRSGWRLELTAPASSCVAPDSGTCLPRMTPKPAPLNYPYIVRSSNDQFGRKVTALRRSLTHDDTEPFETV
jgi:hypothetical protein